MRDESAGDDGVFSLDADVDAVLAEFGGDHRAAICALLHDVATLAADYELSVFRGYVRRERVQIVNVSRHRLGGGPS